MILVLNEWVFHDLWGENGDAAFQQTARFLTALHQSDDRLVVPAATPWESKAFRLMTSADTRVVLASKALHSILYDASTIRVRPEEFPTSFAFKLDAVPDEDVYLVLAYLSAGADLLITTDHGLYTALVENDEVNCRLRDDFLGEYAASRH